MIILSFIWCECVSEWFMFYVFVYNVRVESVRCYVVVGGGLEMAEGT